MTKYEKSEEEIWEESYDRAVRNSSMRLLDKIKKGAYNLIPIGLLPERLQNKILAKKEYLNRNMMTLTSVAYEGTIGFGLLAGKGYYYGLVSQAMPQYGVNSNNVIFSISIPHSELIIPGAYLVTDAIVRGAAYLSGMNAGPLLLEGAYKVTDAVKKKLFYRDPYAMYEARAGAEMAMNRKKTLEKVINTETTYSEINGLQSELYWLTKSGEHDEETAYELKKKIDRLRKKSGLDELYK